MTHSYSSPKSAAITCLNDILGTEQVKCDPNTLDRYGQALNGTIVKPLAVIYPQQEEQVVRVIELAKTESLKLYPLSQGKNFGYGTAQGTNAGQVIMDLSQMNRIIEVHEQLGYAVIQPGVTQGQLYQHLQEKDSRLQLDVTGAGLAASVVGNILERGFGHTDYGDRFANVLSITVMLPSGEVLRTGFGDYHNAKAKRTYRHGLGPSLDGLFSQSNLGIITEMTVGLMPRPEKTCMFTFIAKKEEALDSLVEAVRELRLSGTVNSAVHIANRARVVGQDTKSMAGVWNLSGSISGPASIVRAKRKAVRRTFRRRTRGQLWFVTDRLMHLVNWVDRNIKTLAVRKTLQDAMDLQKGIPTDQSVKTLFDDQDATSQHLDLRSSTKCFRWISAVCPADPASVREMVSLVSQLFEQYGYPFRVTLTFVSPRSLIMITEIAYSHSASELNKATLLYKECVASLQEHGYYPYRSGSGLYAHAASANTPLIKLARKIKTTLDPEQILAPGKYNM